MKISRSFQETTHMPSKPVHCPYCNAAMQLTDDHLSGPRITCPRCGDSFANRDYRGVAAGKSPETAVTEHQKQQPPLGLAPDIRLPEPARKPISNVRIAQIIIVSMICVAIVGGVYAVTTVSFRRDNDRKDESPLLGEELTVAFLPPDCSVVAGWDLGKTRRQKHGKPLLKQISASNVDFTFSRLKQFTGLAPNDVDHLALGIQIAGKLPRFTLAVRTSKPYRLDDIAAATGQKKPGKFRNLPVYRARIKPAAEALIWCLSDRIIIIDIHLLTADLAHLQEIPFPPAKEKESETFSPLIRAGIKEQQQPKDTALWIVADLEAAPSLKQWLKFLPMDLQQLFAQLETLNFGMRFTDNIAVNGAIKAQNEKAAVQLQEFLEQRKPKTAESFTVAGPNTKRSKGPMLDRTWVTLQMRFDENRAVEALESILITARK